jgi:adenylosuccinate synthase
VNHEIPRVVDAVIGGQRGDEGKGKITDDLAQNPDNRFVVRFNGADNAGHTLLYEGKEYDTHGLPSGILHDHITNVVANGVLVNPHHTALEINRFRDIGVRLESDNLAVSNIACMILPHHILLDKIREEGKGKQGSTARGVAYAAGDHALREGVLTESLTTLADRRELLDKIEEGIEKANKEAAEQGLERLMTHNVRNAAAYWMRRAVEIVPYITDTTSMLRDAVIRGDGIIAEGAQAMVLDKNYGQYPCVSSSNTGVAGILSGMAVPHSSIKDVYMVAKIMRSHVGGGPFITEETENEELVERLIGRPEDIDGEYGTSTGRRRRIGYFDIPELKSAAHLNDVSHMVITKLDLTPRFGETVKVATHYNTPDGVIDYVPVGSAKQQAECTPVYEELPLWTEDISNMRQFKELPNKAKKLVSFIEEHVGVKVTHIGVGPGREQLIKR